MDPGSLFCFPEHHKIGHFTIFPSICHAVVSGSFAGLCPALGHSFIISLSLSFLNGDGGCRFWQPVQADSQPKSSGLVLGRWPLGVILHSSNEPGELSQWLCHDDSIINIVLDVIIIIYYLFVCPYALHRVISYSRMYLII